VTWKSNTGIGGRHVGAMSFTGVASTGALVTLHQGPGPESGPGRWSSGSATNTGQADAVYVGGAGNEDATNPTTSRCVGHRGSRLLPRAHGQGLATGYEIVSTVASDSITGNWSNAGSTANTGALMIYKAAAVALPSTTGFIPHPHA
jgi:hypothetical protein